MTTHGDIDGPLCYARVDDRQWALFGQRHTGPTGGTASGDQEVVAVCHSEKHAEQLCRAFNLVYEMAMFTQPHPIDEKIIEAFDEPHAVGKTRMTTRDLMDAKRKLEGA